MANIFSESNSGNNNSSNGEYKQTIYSGDKQTIYWDVDDVLLNSSQAIIDIINKKYGTSKNLSNLKDWTYRSIIRDMNKEKVQAMYASDDFWNRVEFIDGILEIFNKLGDRYNHAIITHGREDNQLRKKQYLFNHKVFGKYLRNNVGYHEIPNHMKKSSVDMSGAIQIDDNCNNLIDTNAKVKILFKNDIDTNYNTNYGEFGGINNLYIVNTVEELEQILMFNLEFNL